MILENDQLDELKTTFFLSNTTKYFYSQFYKSDIINYYYKITNEEIILNEIFNDSKLSEGDSLIYLYFLLFLLYKKQSKKYIEVLKLMVEAKLPRSKELESIMETEFKSINQIIIEYKPQVIFGGTI